SRGIIEETARGARLVLVLEPSLPGGVLKTSRKGVGQYIVKMEGRAAHAGLEPEKGISAITEMARQILHVNSLADSAQGTTVNVGFVSGGTRSNVVPAVASMKVDVRVMAMSEADRIEKAFRNLTPHAEGIRVTAAGGINRPPMERTPAGADLFYRARDISRTLGLELEEGPSGGGSDGNFTAALGVPTLDGLGAVGDGAHATHEYIEADSLVERGALLANLLLQL
ncbi:MAG: M20/M25/M40 family metallo-hydrolase, partial [Chloroflexi bacterium]|nr:M20/M25/M40 family metallo-hydrolase [Chloroflexota bacterium]